MAGFDFEADPTGVVEAIVMNTEPGALTPAQMLDPPQLGLSLIHI